MSASCLKYLCWTPISNANGVIYYAFAPTDRLQKNAVAEYAPNIWHLDAQWTEGMLKQTAVGSG